jgi:hypothetical protein
MRSYKIKALLSSLPAIIHKLWEIVWGNCPPPCLHPSVHHRCLVLLKFCCNKLKNSRIVVAPEFPKVGGGAVIIGENLCGGYLDMEVSGENYTVNWYIFIEFSYWGGGGPLWTTGFYREVKKVEIFGRATEQKIQEHSFERNLMWICAYIFWFPWH